MSASVTPRTLPKRNDARSRVKLRDELISTMPSANAPEKMTPIAVSSLMRRLVATTAIESEVSAPKTNAPMKMLLPSKKAMTMPGKMACDRASPMKLRPRSTM